jgi:putative addiction module component (TIGR02574 family)
VCGLSYGEPEGKILGMTKAAEAVLADALRLDLDARAELVSELLASLDGPADPDAEAAWSAEIERRVAAIEAGTVKLESWEEAKRRISKAAGRRRGPNASANGPPRSSMKRFDGTKLVAPASAASCSTK